MSNFTPLHYKDYFVIEVCVRLCSFALRPTNCYQLIYLLVLNESFNCILNFVSFLKCMWFFVSWKSPIRVFYFPITQCHFHSYFWIIFYNTFLTCGIYSNTIFWICILLALSICKQMHVILSIPLHYIVWYKNMWRAKVLSWNKNRNWILKRVWIIWLCFAIVANKSRLYFIRFTFQCRMTKQRKHLKLHKKKAEKEIENRLNYWGKSKIIFIYPLR